MWRYTTWQLVWMFVVVMFLEKKKSVAHSSKLEESGDSRSSVTFEVSEKEDEPPPHIVFILTDDLGFHYPHYQGNEHVLTPTLDALALQDGILLNGSYMYKYCSPSRGSLMTGRYPWKLVSSRCNLIPSSIPEGVHLDYDFLPKHLAKAGYRSVHIGKWHLGFHEPEYTPVGRGFDASFGFLEGGEDHWTHRCGASALDCKVDDLGSSYFDLWEQNTTHFPGSPAFGRNGTKGDEGTYSGFIFTDRAVDVIETHAATLSSSTSPLFLYLALHNTHAPVEAPERFVNMYPDVEDEEERTFLAMVSVVDESVRNVTDALKRSGMWNNSIVVWTTDNGSPVQVAGSNAPLRGGKGTNFEGGTRVPGFVTGGFVEANDMRGRTLDGLIHVSDWYATFSEIGGLGPTIPRNGPGAADSISMLSYLRGTTSSSPRSRLVHDHHMFTNASAVEGCIGQDPFSMPGYDALGAIRDGDYKLVVGIEHFASWYGDFSPNSSDVKPDFSAVACAHRPCLFDVKSDPGEHLDLADELPDVVGRLWGLFNETNGAYHPPSVPPPQDRKGFCDMVSQSGGWIAPWM
eukprot:g5139.t1